MTIQGAMAKWANYPLAWLNIRIESLTAERAEIARLLDIEQEGQFNRAVFPVPLQFLKCDPQYVIDLVDKYSDHTEHFCEETTNGNFSYKNVYFTSPDAEVAYAIVRTFEPKRLVEVGSGNSTILFRAAIGDSRLNTQITSIDPFPRTEIDKVAHRVFRGRLERIQSSDIFDQLDCDDILFIDSSHQVRIGNDVIRLLLNILPSLRKGVLIHIHDIFLPFEYPREWIIDNRWEWTEQYLVQAMLYGSPHFEVIWPGHYLQRTWPGFSAHFDVKPQGIATSLWLRKIS